MITDQILGEYLARNRDGFNLNHALSMATYLVRQETRDNRIELYQWQSSFIEVWLKPPWEQPEIDWFAVVNSLDWYRGQQSATGKRFLESHGFEYNRSDPLRASGRTTALALLLTLDESLPSDWKSDRLKWWFFDHHPGPESTRRLARMALDFKQYLMRVPNR